MANQVLTHDELLEFKIILLNHTSILKILSYLRYFRKDKILNEVNTKIFLKQQKHYVDLLEISLDKFFKFHEVRNIKTTSAKEPAYSGPTTGPNSSTQATVQVQVQTEEVFSNEFYSDNMPNNYLPDFNINSLPMIPNSHIDIAGNLYGTTSFDNTI